MEGQIQYLIVYFIDRS